jgi:predicted TIM-barrel fold metal-dependent hydrolase
VTVDAPTSALRDLLERTWLVSSDCHVAEPPGLWQERVPASFRDRAPHVVEEHDGDWWYVDGHRTASFTMAQAGKRFDLQRTPLQFAGTFDEVTPAAYDPARYIEANETDGVWGAVVYPSEGLMLFYVPDTEIVDVATRAYNDWLSEFCGEDPQRLKGVAMLNVDDPASAARELERVAALGLGGALVTVAPPVWLPFGSHEYDRLWAAASDLRMPLSLHVASDRADPRAGGFALDARATRPSVFVNHDHQVREALAELIFTGVFERFPDLRVGSVEHGIGWIPYFLAQMDFVYTERPRREHWHRFRDPGALPSDYFRRNVFASFQEDRAGVRLRDLIGCGVMTWGSDFPHGESTYPRSRAILADVLDGVDPDDARRIVCTNAAELYGFSVPAT